MNDFEKSAKDAGYRAALRGESMYQYERSTAPRIPAGWHSSLATHWARKNS